MSERITCANDDCGAAFRVHSRNPDDDLECPSCRMGDRPDDRDRSDAQEKCPVCNSEPLSERELRSRTGQQIDGQVCVLRSGNVLVHPDNGDTDE